MKEMEVKGTKANELMTKFRLQTAARMQLRRYFLYSTKRNITGF